MKDELSGKILKGVVVLRSKICNYLKGNRSVNKKAKVTKKSVIKRKKIKILKSALRIIKQHSNHRFRSHRFRSDRHNIFT